MAAGINLETARARLVRVDEPQHPPAPAPVELQGFMIQVGNSSFYVTHVRDGVQMLHSQEEWQNLFAGQIQTFVEQLEQDNADFDPNQVSELSIGLSDRGEVSYKTQADPTRVLRLQNINTTALRILGRVLADTLPPLPGTLLCQGSFHQATSPLGSVVRGACSAIDTQFAEKALVAGNVNVLNSAVIDNAILEGQLKYSDMTRTLRQNQHEDRVVHMDFVFEGIDNDFNHYFPLLQRGAVLNGIIPQEQPEEVYLAMLKQLQNAVPTRIHAVFGGITNAHGESFGLVLYRDSGNPRNVQRVAYFDSHSHPRENGSSNACVRLFNSLEESAAFLAKRNPYVAPRIPVAPGQIDRHNALSITPLHIDVNLIRLLAAQEDDERTEFIENIQRDNRVLSEIIALIVSRNLTPQGQNPTILHGRQQITQNPRVLANVRLEQILEHLSARERDQLQVAQIALRQQVS